MIRHITKLACGRLSGIRLLNPDRARGAVIGIGSTRLYQIERGIRLPHEDEVIVMAKEYDAPELIRYYCEHVCAIGAYCKKDNND